MDLLEDPEIKKTYEKCKYIVKLWEHNFAKSEKRQPSKLDIREAPTEVRHAYRKYYQLKSNALEQSFRNVEGFDIEEDIVATTTTTTSSEETVVEPIPEAVWGSHLNNTPNTDSAKESGTEEISTVSLNISKKLFCGSKFNKRNPRKSFSFSQKIRTCEDIDTSGFISLSQPVTSSKFTSEEAISFSQNINVLTLQTNIKLATNSNTKPLSVDIIQSSLNNDKISLKTCDSAWLNRVKINSETSTIKTKLDYNTDDDIIEDSDTDETTNKFEFLHIAKKRKVDASITETPTTINEVQNNIESVGKPQEKEEVNLKKQQRKQTKTKTGKKPIKKKKKQPDEKVRLTERQPRRSARASKVINTNFEEISENPFKVDYDSDDPEFLLSKARKIVEEENSVVAKKPVVKVIKHNKSKIEEDESSVSVAYELEYSVKPRKVAARFTNIKEVLKSQSNSENVDEDTPEDKKKNALEKKIAAGALNDNFVTINLKKKVYSKFRGGVKFSKYKKSQWKAKKKALYGPDMDMGGCDGERITCFTCGEVGHFARSCKNTKGDQLLPLSGQNGEEDEECPFPTLQEASKMAKLSLLKIRKSNKIPITSLPKTNTEETNEDSDSVSWDEDIDDDDLLKESMRLEEHIKTLDLTQYVDNLQIVRPFFESSEPNHDEVYAALELFGYNSFRNGQEKAVMRILQGKSTLVTLSTGSGKSLCYQLPAYLYSTKTSCITLVISPLVSLMEDQITGIPKFLKAACLHTNQSKKQREKILEALSSGGLNVLLVSPEAVVAGEKQTGFGSLLRKLPPIAFACIDEAHCVSQWSHNFRPSYLMICRVLRESLGVRTILGLTATATKSTCDSIIRHLNIPDGNDGIISDIPLPDNLRLTTSKDQLRDTALLNMVLSERFANSRSIIVYCTRREECERIASFLRTSLQGGPVKSDSKKRKRLNLQAEPYHAGLSASRRRTIQGAFMSGELRIVVATVAFGMGINKSDIRAVIHYNMPRSFESYVQEVGRAGRDGLPAECHVFLDSEGRDENELRRHIHANSIDRHVIRKLLQRIFIPCSCTDTCPKHEVAFSIESTVKLLDIPEENISTLLCYLELHEHKYIELLNPAYTMCKVISYGGPMIIRKAAKDCPPLSMALALYKGQENDLNVLEFPVVDVASAMGWESGICKHKLKNLEWITVNNQPKRSLLSVTFSNLGFRLLAPGNLTDEQLDEGLDVLYNRVKSQETTALKQLKAVYKTLTKVARNSYKSVDSSDSDEIKTKIRAYFAADNPLEGVDEQKVKLENEDQLVSDIRGFMGLYSNTQVTGRVVARIFHGILSPNYPAVEWGRCKYWRSHLADDFHEICRLATREIIKFRL